MTRALQPELKKLLEDVGCEEELVQHVLARKCYTMDMFQHWANERTPIEESMLKGSKFAEDMPSIALMRSAWERADTKAQRAKKRAIEGIEDHDDATSMDPQAQVELMAKFRQFYQIKRVPAARICSDTLLNCFKKEFERFLPTPFDFSRIRTQAEGIMKMPSKRTRISEKFAFVQGEDPLLDAAKESMDLLHWFELFDIVGLSWAVAGCFETDWQAPGAAAPESIKFVHLQDVTDYKWEFQSRMPELRERFADWSISRYYNRTEIEFRGKAIEMTRGELKTPFGPALNLAVGTNPALWSKYESMLVEFEVIKKGARPHHPPQGGQQPYIPQLPAIANGQHESGGGRGGAAPPPKGKGKGNRFARTREAKNGEKLCVRWNDKRGCTQKQCKFGHKCDMVLASTGDACLGNHKACDHDNKQHGQAKSQKN